MVQHPPSFLTFKVVLCALLLTNKSASAWLIESILPEFSPFAPLVDDVSYSFCDVSTNVPCNSEFFNALCDISACAQLRKTMTKDKRKRSVCTCYNKRIESHLRFLSFMILNPDMCRQYHVELVHDFDNCLVECNQLHRAHPLEEFFGMEFKAAPRGSFGCIVDPERDVSSRLFGSEYVKSRGRHILCFCYRAPLGFFRMIRIIK